MDSGSVAARYARVMQITVVIIVAVWHFGYDIVILTKGWSLYRPAAAAVGAWVVLAAVQIGGSVLLLRGRLGPVMAWSLAILALVAGAVATFTYPTGEALSDISWAWNTVGWFAVLLLMNRPLVELAALSAANTAVTVVALAAGDALGRVMIARLIAVTYATVGAQLLFAFVHRHLVLATRRTAELAAAREEREVRLAADEAVHAGRAERYQKLRDRAEPLLRGLAEQRLDPADPAIQRAAGVEAARLRRLFAETDDAPHPLLHELRACADIAERRDVDVTMLAYGDLPALPAPARRDLTEAPMLVLASAASWARLTVVANPDLVVVSVVANAPPDVLHGLAGPAARNASVMHDDEEQWLWVESRWVSV